MNRVRRSYYCTASYPGLKVFIFGTVWADGTEHARREIEAAMARTLPPGATIHEILPGAIVVVPRDEDRD